MATPPTVMDTTRLRRWPKLSAAEWVAQLPTRPDDEFVSMWEIVGTMRAAGLDGAALTEAVQDCVLGVLRWGAEPVMPRSSGNLFYTPAQFDFTAPEDVALVITLQWRRFGEDPDPLDLGFHRPPHTLQPRSPRSPDRPALPVFDPGIDRSLPNPDRGGTLGDFIDDAADWIETQTVSVHLPLDVLRWEFRLLPPASYRVLRELIHVWWAQGARPMLSLGQTGWNWCAATCYGDAAAQVSDGIIAELGTLATEGEWLGIHFGVPKDVIQWTEGDGTLLPDLSLPLEGWFDMVVAEVGSGPVAFAQIVTVLQGEYALRGALLTDAVTRCLIALHRRGARPVVGPFGGFDDLTEVPGYSGTAEAAAAAIVAEWQARGGGPPWWLSARFALPQLIGKLPN